MNSQSRCFKLRRTGTSRVGISKRDSSAAEKVNQWVQTWQFFRNFGISGPPGVRLERADGSNRLLSFASTGVKAPGTMVPSSVQGRRWVNYSNDRRGSSWKPETAP